MSDFRSAFMALLLDLRPTSAAAGRTPRHFNLTRTPVDFRVVLPEPGVSQYHVLVAKTGYSKMGMFGMVSVEGVQSEYAMVMWIILRHYIV